MKSWEEVRSLYMVPDDIVYLNNGSYGPTPRPVFEALVRYMQQLEENPATWNVQEEHVRKVVEPKMAEFVGADPRYIAFVTNLTFGMNVFSRGLRGLKAGDEILTTNIEYGAVDNAWDYSMQRQGVGIKKVSIPAPPESPEQIVDLLEKGITPRTRALYCSHVTTGTGLVLPVKKICAMARAHGLVTLIDGAHAPGMIPVDIKDIGCDFYTGNCHKWMGSPKGTAFIAMTESSWEKMEPFIVAWGWYKGQKESFEGNFDKPGIHNTALTSAVADAIDFQLSIGKDRIEARGREMSETAKDRFLRFPGVKLLTPRDPRMCGSMAAFSLPPVEDDKKMDAVMKARRIVIPAGANGAGGRMRISTHIYNTMRDLEALENALKEIYGW
jgi:isopenicillin-N epimerase